MVQKRPFNGRESLEISSKVPRPLEGVQRLVSFSESVFPEYASQDPHASEDQFTKVDSKTNAKVSEPRESIQDIDTGLHSCNSNSSWATSSTSEDDSQLMKPFNLSFQPEVYSHDRPLRPVTLREDIYSLLLHYPPQKLVPIGPDHQAEIPPWSSPPHENLLGNLNKDNTLAGKSVIPMPDFDSSSSYCDEVGRGRSNCICEDGYSDRCVCQHIAEARNKLKRDIGQESFEELGFYNMGEQQTGQKWSEKEEQIFHGIVFSNPASLGRNFWTSLSAVFPSRTKNEIVSYYYNVSILQRRAQQNRNDAMDIDSDDDEWQGSDEVGENEHGATEKDEDSPVYHGRFDYNRHGQGNLQDCDEEFGKLFKTREFPGYVSKFCDKSNSSMLNYCYSSPTIVPRDESPRPESGDSCTSSDLGTSRGTEVWNYGLNKSSMKEMINEYSLESCDTRKWDSGFSLSFKTKVDFLPTCRVIKEVFGED